VDTARDASYAVRFFVALSVCLDAIPQEKAGKVFFAAQKPCFAGIAAKILIGVFSAH
jgi:hypothetical protein